MIDLTFDNGTVEQFTLVLSQRDYTHLGQLSNVANLKFKANLNSADELSFDVYKELDGHKEILWDDIYDLRLIWIRELNAYFEIDVESIDQVHIIKTITAKSLCESELSQTGLHDIEINTADDIARPDYDPRYPTVFYRSLPLQYFEIVNPTGNPKQKNYYEKTGDDYAPTNDTEVVPGKTYYSYNEEYDVKKTLMNLQRIFSISDTTLYDFMVGECSEQFNCLFQFDSATRTISAYDLRTTCHNNYCPYYINENHEYYSGDVHLRYRGLYNDRCPICGSTDITSFGEDTTVFVSTENLTDEVKFDTDVASLKNCFRLEAGDDNMTAAVINSNPNGTRYIYEFNADSKKDMPQELVSLIESYDELYNEYNNTRDMELNTTLISDFNALCAKYDVDGTYHKGDEWKPIVTPVLGYKNLIPHYYNVIDFYQYLKSSLMPVVNIPKTTVHEEMIKLENALTFDNVVGLSTTPRVAGTVANAVNNLCKLYVNTGLVKVSVETTSWDPQDWGIWTGTIKLTSFEDDADYETTTQTLVVSLDFATFMDQKISKYIKRAKESSELYDVLKIDDLDVFKNQLKLYGVSRLQSFRDALAAVIGILAEADQGHDGYEKVTLAEDSTINPHDDGLFERTGDGFTYTITLDTSVVPGKDYYKESITTKSVLYDDFYKKYYKKLQAAEEELNLRNQEVALVYGTFDLNGNVQTKGVFQYISDSIINVQRALNFKLYVYNNTDPHSYDLYNVYTTYIREDTYSNSNYISDDLNNDQLFENAGRFLEIAQDELHKSATYQHSITSNLNNLMAIDEFKPLLNKFNLGNWIRIQQDERIYRLRLISYSIDFDNITKLDTEFSDVTITADGLNDVMSVIKQASSMASSYGYTQQQAETGSKAQTNYIDDWLQNGLNSALIRINNNNDEDISIDNTGILARTYDDIAETHEPEQLRITHNVIAFTDDNWQSVKTSLGKFSMTHHTIDNNGLNTDKNAISRYDEYGLVANAVLAGWVVGSYIEGGNIISSHFQTPGNDSYIDMSDIVESGSGKEYFIKMGNAFFVQKNGDAKISGEIAATKGHIGNWVISPISDGEFGRGSLYYLPSGGEMGSGISALLSPIGYTTTSSGASSSHPYKRFGWSTTTNGESKSWVLGVNDSFGVTTDGYLYASGTINALEGRIGNGTNYWHIGPNSIYNGCSSLSSGSTGTYVGTDGIRNNGTGGTYVGTGSVIISNGAITADKGRIGNFIINNYAGNYTAGYFGDVYSETGYQIGMYSQNNDQSRIFARICYSGYSNEYSQAVEIHPGRIEVNGSSALIGGSNDRVPTARIEVFRRNPYDSGPGEGRIIISGTYVTKYDNNGTLYDAQFVQTSSDIRLKKNIKDINYNNLKCFFKELRPIEFNYKKQKEEIKEQTTNFFGLIAQEAQFVFDKYLQNTNIVETKEDGYMSIDYYRFIGLLIPAVKDLYTQIDDLKDEIKRLKGEQ